MSAGSISFAGNDLQTANILTQDINPGAPDILANVYQLAHANKSSLTSINYPARKITISGEIIGTSIADTDARVDAFLGYFTSQNANLDIGWNGGTRRYIANATAISPSRPGGLLNAPFSVTFICASPFGFDTSNASIVSTTARTLGFYADPFTVAASAPWQQPVITYTLTAFTGTGSQSISFSNTLTGQTLVITRSNWTAGDVIVIDCTVPSVKVNGIEVDFSGAFPQYAKGSQTLTYVDNFTTRTFNISAVYLPVYM